jgi:excisionase family DNA binding protein
LIGNKTREAQGHRPERGKVMKPSNPILTPDAARSQGDRWLTVREAAAILRVHPTSIYRSCSRRRIPHAKAAGVGIRIDRHDLEKFLENAKIPVARTRKAKF